MEVAIIPIGERIGQAYVRVILDGSNNREFGEQLRAAGEAGGRDSGIGAAEEFDKTFTKKMREGQRKRGRILAKDVETSLAKQFRRSKLIEKELGTEWFKNFESGIRSRVKDSDIADVMIREVRKKFVQSGGDRGLIESLLGTDKSSLGRFRASLDAAAAEVERVRLREASAAQRAAQDSARLAERGRQTALKRLQEEANLELKVAAQRKRENEQLLKDIRADIKELDKFSQFVEKAGKNFITTRAEAEHFRSVVEHLRPRLDRAFSSGQIDKDTFKRLRKDLDGFGREVDRTNFRLNRLRLGSRRFADALSLGIGRKSRNNFLNFFGVLARNAINFFSSIAIEAVGMFDSLRRTSTAFFVAFAEGFRASSEQGSGFFKSIQDGFRNTGNVMAGVVTSILEGGTTIAAAAAVIAIGLTAVSFVVGPLVTALVGLGGAITALATVVGGALVGGLGILAAALVPVAAAIGGVATAFFLMDDAAKKALKESVKPLIARFKELGNVVVKEGFSELPKQMKELSTTLKDPVFNRFAANVGSGIRDFIQQMVEGTKESKSFFDGLTKSSKDTLTVGEQIKSLGITTRNLFGGIGGTILATQPAVKGFLTDLQNLSIQFNNFANNTAAGGGRDQLTLFFNNALASLRSLGGLVRSLSGLFVDLFNVGGAQAGIGLIDSLRGKIEQLRDFINKNPDKVRKFFGDAKRITEEIGGALLTIVEDLGKLNTEANRQTLRVILKGIEIAADAATESLNFVGEAVFALFHPVKGFVALIGHATELAAKFFKLMGSAPGGEGQRFRDLSQQLQDVADKAKVVANGKPIGVDAELAPASSAKIARQIGGIKGKPLPVTAQLTPAAVAKIRGQLGGVKSKPISMTAVLSTASVSKIRGQLGGIKQSKAIQIAVDNASALANIHSLQNALNAIKPKPIKITITSNAESELNKIRALDRAKISDKAYTTTHTIKTVREGAARGGIREQMKSMAEGGLARFRQQFDPFTTIAESGAEAIVPLSRPLSQVDPSVRLLSAIAQGKVPIASGGRTVDASGWTIVSNTADAGAVAQEALARLTAAAY